MPYQPSFSHNVEGSRVTTLFVLLSCYFQGSFHVDFDATNSDENFEFVALIISKALNSAMQRLMNRISGLHVSLLRAADAALITTKRVTCEINNPSGGCLDCRRQSQPPLLARAGVHQCSRNSKLREPIIKDGCQTYCAAICMVVEIPRRQTPSAEI